MSWVYCSASRIQNAGNPAGTLPGWVTAVHLLISVREVVAVVGQPRRRVTPLVQPGQPLSARPYVPTDKRRIDQLCAPSAARARMKAEPGTNPPRGGGSHWRARPPSCGPQGSPSASAPTGES